MDWQPIETAPSDQAVVDLWAVSDTSPEGYRVPDCTRCHIPRDAWTDNRGRWVNGMNYYDDEGDECLAPGNDPKPEEAVVRVVGRRRVTHWMLRPAAPVQPL